jgi:histidine decarboxylase
MFAQRMRTHELSNPLEARFEDVFHRMRSAHANHLGYPYNLNFSPGVPTHLHTFLINNLGDPYAGSHYGSEVCDLEREAVSWLMELWHCDNRDDHWGSIGASGTEGNIWGIHLGREAFPNAVLLYSADAHYSIPKAARLLRMEAQCVASNTAGEMDLDALSHVITTLKAQEVVVALTCGTTMKGAHDDVAGVISRLDAAGFDNTRRYIHLDGALNAMVIPFVDDAPESIRPSFRQSIDSLSVSGHKMIGTPMPCGVLVSKRKHVERIASAISYLRSNDTTLMGSRNGHAVLAVWARFFGHGLAGYRRDAASCLTKASELAASLRVRGVPVLLNEHSLTVVFPQPSEDIVKRYQLACYKGEAHVVVMPNVTSALLARFLADYLDWWETMSHACDAQAVRGHNANIDGSHRHHKLLS